MCDKSCSKKEGRIKVDCVTIASNESDPPNGKQGTVRFSHATTRYYNTTLGDNPSCSSGPPLSLGWDYKQEYDEVYEFGEESGDESDNLCSGPCPVISRRKRESMLHLLGYSQAEVAASVRAVLKAKRQRRRCYHNSSDWSRLEKAVWKRFKRGVKVGKRQRPSRFSSKDRKGSKSLDGTSDPLKKSELDCDRRNFDRYLQGMIDYNDDDSSSAMDQDSLASKDDNGIPDLFCSDDGSASGSSLSESICNTNKTDTEAEVTTNQCGVHFSEARVRYYDTILGDHPCCSGGPPVSLGWKYQPEDDEVVPIGSIDESKVQGHYDPISYDNDDDEVIGESFQMCHCPTLSRSTRENMLHELGYSKSEVSKAVRSLNRAKRRRRKTYHNLYVMCAEEAVEGLTKSMAGLLLQNNKMYDISAYIEELSADSRLLLRSSSDSLIGREGPEDDCLMTSTSISKDIQRESAFSEGVSLNDSDDEVEVIANAEARQETHEDILPLNESLKLPSKKSGEERSPVRFGNINIRHYDIEVGDNPGASSPGAVLTIGWGYKEGEPIDIDLYEESQGPKRYKSRDEMRVGRKERERILLDCGYSMSELHRASSSIRNVKAQRRATVANVSNVVAEERREVMSRAVKRMVGLRKSGARQIEELWVQAQERQI